ncbi:hypothetical protein DITRI_Ditri04bG0139200 [Diplodiscus trichospermus]
MARLAFLFTVIFLLFTFSHARFFTVEPEHGANSDETIPDLPESNPETTSAILLPSERAGFEPAKIVDFKHDDASETESSVESVPLTTISFRPVNRHFPRRPLIPFRHKHNCRFHKRFRPMNPGFQQKRYISYGNDMILSDLTTRFDPVSSDGVRQIEARWARFPDDGAESKEHVEFMKPHQHDHDHDEDHHHHHHRQHRRHHYGQEDERDEEEEHGHEHEDKEEGGFMGKFSKYFFHF